MPAVLHRAATPAGLSMHGCTSEQLSEPRRMPRFCGMDRPRRDPTASSRAGKYSPPTWLSSRRSPRCFRCPPAARMLFPQYPARPWSSPAPVSFSFRAFSFLFSARSRASSADSPLFPADPPATAASPPSAAFTAARDESGTAIPRPAPSWRPGRQGSSSLSRTSCLALPRPKRITCRLSYSFDRKGPVVSPGTDDGDAGKPPQNQDLSKMICILRCV